MLQSVLIHEVIACATPGWRHKHRVELFVRISGWESNTRNLRFICHHIDLTIVFKMEEVAFDNLKILMLHIQKLSE